MATFTGTFNTAEDFTNTSTEYTGGALQLTTPVTAGLSFTQAFAVDTGFTYNNTKAEFVGGVLRKKDQTAANSRMAGFMTTKDLAWNKTATTTGTLNGAPTFGSGKMVCTGSQGVYYTKNTAASETYKTLYTPNYTTSPPTNVNILSNWNGTNNNDRFGLIHSSSGNTPRINLYNSAAGAIYSTVAIGAAWTPTAGVEYEIEAVLDSAAGTVRVFIDGVLHGTLSPAPWTRGTSSSRYYVGASPVVYNQAEGSFDNPIWFNAANHTVGYTPGYTIAPTIYAESKADLPPFSHLGPGGLSLLTNFAVTEVGSPQYLVEGKYFNGSWVVSDGTYAQSNSKATIIANLATLSVTALTDLDVSVVFAANNTLASVDDLTVTYSGNRYAASGTATTTEMSADEMLTFAITTENTPTNTTVSYGVKKDNVLMWWNGAAWVTSNGTAAQLNSAADINTNAAALLSGPNSTLKGFVLMETTDNTVTPSLVEVLVSFAFGGVPTTLETCVIWGYVKDISGVGIGGATVTMSLVRESAEYKEGGDTVLGPSVSVLTQTTDDPGYFEVVLVRSSEYERNSGDTQLYKLEVTKTSTNLKITENSQGDEITFSVPDALDKNITDLITAA